MSLPRLFIAAWLPGHTIETLEALPRKERPGVRIIPPENWHVTLRFLGQCGPSEVVAALDEVTLPVAHARLGPAVDVLHERNLVAPVGGVEELAAAVVAATRMLGDPPPRRSFGGHVTLARRRRGAPVPKMLGTPVRSEWHVHEVALVQSRLHPDGARYETLRTWPTMS